MIRFFSQLTLGHFRRHRLEALLCLAGVALGVAVMIAIDAAVRACVDSFEGAVGSLAERSTHGIFAEQGTISDDAYLDLKRRRLPFPMAPVIERGVLTRPAGAGLGAPRLYGTLSAGDDPERDGVVVRLIGMDVFAERNLRSFTKVKGGIDDDAYHRFLTEPGQVVLVDVLAKRLNAHVGDAIQLTVGSKRVDVRVDGIIEPTGAARTQLTDIILADMATAQELTGLVGQLDRIDVRLESEEEEKTLAAALPRGLVLRSTQERKNSLAELIRSYRMNLAALSMMASFVAIFIVYNSMLISVQQHVTSLGILRCLGSSRSQVGAIYLFEALLFALGGAVIGVVGGWLLARGLVGYVSTTINDIYAAVRPGPVPLGAVHGPRGWASP